MWRQHNTRSMSLTVQSWVNAFLVQVFQRVDSTNHRFRSIETMIRETPTGVWQKFNKEMNTEKVREDKDTIPVAWEENQLSRTTKQIWDNLQSSSHSLRFALFQPFRKTIRLGFSAIFFGVFVRNHQKEKENLQILRLDLPILSTLLL